LNYKSEGAGSAEVVVVAIDARDYRVLKTKRGHGLGYAAGLVEIDWLWAAFGDGAESAAACAKVAQHHECCGFVVPAFADVGAVGAFADGVERERAGKGFEAVVVLTHGRARL